jgi:hypothetical protein
MAVYRVNFLLIHTNPQYCFKMCFNVSLCLLPDPLSGRFSSGCPTTTLYELHFFPERYENQVFINFIMVIIFYDAQYAVFRIHMSSRSIYPPQSPALKPCMFGKVNRKYIRYSLHAISTVINTAVTSVSLFYNALAIWWLFQAGGYAPASSFVCI